MNKQTKELIEALKDGTIGDLINKAVEIEVNTAKEKLVDDALNLLSDWRANHSGYVEQCRGVGQVMDLIEGLRL